MFQRARVKVYGAVMSERSEVKRDGAKAQKNSGRGDYQKGDAQWGKFLVDYKESGKSFTLDNASSHCIQEFNFR